MLPCIFQIKACGAIAKNHLFKEEMSNSKISPF
jgi:hypothetical protein